MSNTSPFSPESTEITIRVHYDEEKNIPAGLCTFTVGTETDPDMNPGSRYVIDGEFIFINRKESANDVETLSSYDITPNLTTVYYNSNKEIVKLYLKEYNVDPDDESQNEDGYDDIIKFFNLIKDEEAMNAFRVLSWYWTCLGLGFSILHSIENGKMPPPMEFNT